MSLFDRAMWAMPKILTGVAILYFLAGVSTAWATGMEVHLLGNDETSVFMKVRAIFLIFMQPLIPSVILMFGAAHLWRLDRGIGRTDSGAAE